MIYVLTLFIPIGFPFPILKREKLVYEKIDPGFSSRYKAEHHKSTQIQ